MKKVFFILLAFFLVLHIRADDYIVISDGLNVRSGPSASSTILGILHKNDPVKSIEIVNGWVKFYYQGSIAYVNLTYLEKLVFNIRPLPVTNSKIESETKNTTSSDLINFLLKYLYFFIGIPIIAASIVLLLKIKPALTFKTKIQRFFSYLSTIPEINITSDLYNNSHGNIR